MQQVFQEGREPAPSKPVKPRETSAGDVSHQMLRMQKLAGNTAVSRALRIQRAPIDLKRIAHFLQWSQAKREAMLDEQTPGHLVRLTAVLQNREHGASPAEKKAIDECLAYIPTVTTRTNVADIKRIGRGANWANAVLHIDGSPAAVVKSTSSGVFGGAKSRWGFKGKGKNKIVEILISHNDSEATVFNELEGKVDHERLSHAKSVKLDFVSTNGACNGCKGRIDAFIKEAIVPFVDKRTQVEMTYRYLIQPKEAYRGIPTYYGWDGDTQDGDNQDFYIHTVRYSGAAA